VKLAELLKKYDLAPRKGLGQNFLTDPYHLGQIVAAAELDGDALVVEVGPGPGTLTTLLTEQAGRVVAVELDGGMVNLLRQEYGHLPNLAVVQADILETDLAALLVEQAGPRMAQSPYYVVANLPYYITSAVIRHLLESNPRPQRLVVTIQKEVAQRIVAQPGQMSLLAVSVQFYGKAQLVHRIPAGAFFPPPKVDSAVVRIDTYPASPLDVNDVSAFFRVVKAGFSQKRKQLKNTLAAGLQQPTCLVVRALIDAGIDPARRAQSLSLAEWGRLANTLTTAQS
jgi:16S rRNA (adenine1518-N6/adenine1519-N6)-dimethyltransferase